MKCSKCFSEAKVFRQVYKNGTEHAVLGCEECGDVRSIAKRYLKLAVGDCPTKKQARQILRNAPVAAKPPVKTVIKRPPVIPEPENPRSAVVYRVRRFV